jgi:hypothetical protein
MLRAKEWDRGEDRVTVSALDPSQNLDADRSVRDRVQSSQRRAVVKDHVSDERTIQRALAVQYGTAERVDQGRERGTSGRGHVVGDVVGVHDRESEVPKAIGDHGFSRANAPGDDNSFH